MPAKLSGKVLTVVTKKERFVRMDATTVVTLVATVKLVVRVIVGGLTVGSLVFATAETAKQVTVLTTIPFLTKI